jgi:hypothetical protein
MEELPPKPELETRERVGQFGEIVEELTPESEEKWAQYLRDRRLAEIAIYRSTHDKEETNTENA